MAVLVAFALALGAPAWMVGVAVLTIERPWVAPFGGAVWAGSRWWARRRVVGSDDVEARYLAGVAGELRAGSTIRVALVDAADRVPGAPLRGVVRAAGAGLEVDRIAVELRRALPAEGPLAAAAVRIVGSLGGAAAATFDQLATHAAERVALRRELRALTAQARLSAAVVALAPPLLGLPLIAASGGLLHDPAALAFIGAGLLLEAAGGAVIAFMLRRGR